VKCGCTARSCTSQAITYLPSNTCREWHCGADSITSQVVVCAGLGGRAAQRTLLTGSCGQQASTTSC
jgi:hypothetical protein